MAEYMLERCGDLPPEPVDNMTDEDGASLAGLFG